MADTSMAGLALPNSLFATLLIAGAQSQKVGVHMSTFPVKTSLHGEAKETWDSAGALLDALLRDEVNDDDEVGFDGCADDTDSPPRPSSVTYSWPCKDMKGKAGYRFLYEFEASNITSSLYLGECRAPPPPAPDVAEADASSSWASSS